MTTLQPQLRISMRSPWAERGGGSSAQDEAGWLQRRLMAQRKGAVQSDFQNVWSYYYFLSLNSVRFFCGQSNLIFTWISLKGSLCFMGQKILNSMGSPPENLLVSLSKQSYCFYLLVPSTLLPWVAKTLLWPPRGTSYWDARPPFNQLMGNLPMISYGQAHDQGFGLGPNQSNLSFIPLSLNKPPSSHTYYLLPALFKHCGMWPWSWCLLSYQNLPWLRLNLSYNCHPLSR